MRGGTRRGIVATALMAISGMVGFVLASVSAGDTTSASSPPAVKAGLSCASAQLCRSGGSLRHDPNSAGRRVWTTSCGPNTSPRAVDPSCSAITNCSGAGGFGKFLSAVTGQCQSKSFEGYFGLDGMTFGILDWTSDNLPVALEFYHRRDPQGFSTLVEDAGIPLRGGCADPAWVCQANRSERLMCDAGFRDAFRTALRSPAFQKAEVDFALEQYEKRLLRYESLGLKSEYGNIAMAVVANNLRSGQACRPATWKAACSSEKDERSLVQCMLSQYVAHECRGSLRGSRERVAQINAVFVGDRNGKNIHPSADQVLSCVPGQAAPK
jgi:hypothetical protein